MKPVAFLVGGVIAIVLTVAATLLRLPLSSIEDQVTSLKYSQRGPLPADTNVIIVYIDGDAVKDLGWPVRRNFYALMVKALTDLQAKVIGIEPVFEEASREYPEYDELLATTVAASNRVVLASYFQQVLPEEPRWTGIPTTSPLFLYPNVRDVVYFGREHHLPFRALRGNAAGIGHLNFVNTADLPLFIRSEADVVPCFDLELLRLYYGVRRAAVETGNDRVNLGSGLTIPAPNGGTTTLNYPGPLSSFRHYPFLEVLRSYDAFSHRRDGSIPVAEFKDKIVLVGIIAEGRSAFVASPLAARYPTLALHASFLDNALQSRFMMQPGVVTVCLVAFLTGLCCFVLASLRRFPLVTGLAFAIPFLLSWATFPMFSGFTFLFPVVPLIVAGCGSALAGLFYVQRQTGKHVTALEAERSGILAQLKEKETKVTLLENELLRLGESRTSDRSAGLLEEIRKYKAEIHALSSRADDMEIYISDEEEKQSTLGEFEGIVYHRHGPMKEVVDFVVKIASSDAPVLIVGESGTGKELVARAIHNRSARRSGPFIAVNCGALAESLLESELFGHEKGSFTGAVKDKPGRFELANGGTIFLDEIGDISESFQLKLLRVLQEGELERVGATQTIKVNVRFVAATNKDLKELVKARHFREDLYYRLNVLTVGLPPLRERPEDIPLLVNHFLAREGQDMQVSNNVMDLLRANRWGGNIRELESVMKRAVLLARADQRSLIALKDLGEEVLSSSQGALAIEDQILESVRQKGFSRSSVTETANELGGLSRGTVAEYLRGESLKAFVEHDFDMQRAVQHLTLSDKSEVNERATKKLREYLGNIAEGITTSSPWESNLPILKSKTKNLPHKYHRYLHQIAERWYRGLWKI